VLTSTKTIMWDQVHYLLSKLHGGDKECNLTVNSSGTCGTYRLMWKDVMQYTVVFLFV